MTESQNKPNRRAAFALLGGLVAIAGGWQIWSRRPEALAFEPIANAPGWRIAELGQISFSPSDAMLLGLEDAPVKPIALSDLAGVVHNVGQEIAVFSDAFCPHCRRLVPQLADVFPAGVTFHALPFFGPFSEQVARASIAAEIQYDDGNMHVLMHTLPIRPTQSFFRRVAEQNGLDPDKLIRDMAGPEVTARLQASRGAAERLGIWGTPAVVVGKRVVLGTVEIPTVQDLLTG